MKTLNGGAARLLLIAFMLAAGTAHADSVSIEEAAAALAQSLELKLSEAPVREHPAWRKPERIAVYLPPAVIEAQPELHEQLKALTQGVEVVVMPRDLDGRSELEAVANVDVFFGWCNPDIVKAATELRYLHAYSAGVDQCALSSEVTQRSFILTNSQKVAGPPMAEHTIALMLAITRNLPIFSSAQAEGKWDRSGTTNPGMTMVTGKTMLILGLGGIGKEVAKRAHALGMRVIATRNSSRAGPDYVDYVGLSNERYTLAEQAHVVVNTLPLTQGTQDMIDRSFFEAMRAGSYYINVGRGGTTVTEDMVAALKSNKLAGLGLDVTDPEPLPPEHELWQMRNVIITPHISTASDIGAENRWILALENMRRYLAGESLYNPVDLKRGY